MTDCETGQCSPSEDPMDAKTFTPPYIASGEAHDVPSIVIEFCNRCRWLHRATWVQTELFLTFPDTSAEQDTNQKEDHQANGTTTQDSKEGKYGTAGRGLKAITLIPCNAPETGGRFRVWLHKGDAGMVAEGKQSNRQSYQEGRVILLWDRKIKGGFPELKELKQFIRDEIAPTYKLGHSDKKDSQ